MRRAFPLLLCLALVPVLPVTTAHADADAAPHPVAPHVVSLAVDGPVPALAGDQPLAFSAFGASWTATDGSGQVQVRVRSAQSGTWSDWTPLDAADSGPDPGSPDAVAAGTTVASEPVWAGPSDAVQTRVIGTEPANLHVELVDPGTSAADDSATDLQPAAAAVTGRPTILTRADWGADESLRQRQCPSGPSYSSTIKIGFVHHTVSSNDYSAAEVPAMIRAFYAYHVEGNGWCDLAYNFLVDRFGRIWEGRYGGVDKAVVGSHTGGFNKDSFGVGMIGDFSDVAPDSAMQQSVAVLMAWKLGSYYRNPLGTDTLTYAGGHYRFCGAKECPVGSTVTLDVISGHRDADVGHTECPGDAGEAVLPALRTGTVAAMGGGLVLPAVQAVDHRVGDGGLFTITAGVVTRQSWTLTVTDATGAVVRTVSGDAARGATITASWDGLAGTGLAAPPGSYTLTLTSAGPTGQAIPYAATVTLHPPVELTGAAQVGYGQQETLTGSTYPGSTVTIWQAPQGTTVYGVAGTVLADPSGAFTYSYAGTTDVSTYAQVGTAVSTVVTTAVGPTITGPAAVVPGSLVTLTGTAPPGAQVTVFLVDGTNPPVAHATVTAAADGTWTTTYTADLTYSWYATANTLTSATGSTSINAPPTMTGPAAAAYRSVVTLAGVSPAGAGVQLWRCERGQTTFHLDAAVVATAAGTFSWTYPATDDFRWYATTLSGQSATGLTQVGVTATGPPTIAKGLPSAVTGTALPSSAVQVWRAAGDGGFVKVGSAKARTDGSWSWPFTFEGTTRWYATSRDLQSPTGLTLVTIPPQVSGPATTSYGATVRVSGRAAPGATVTLHLHRRGSTGYTAAATSTTGLDGRWAMTYRADDDYRWYAASVAGSSKVVTTVVGPVAAAVASAPPGAHVRLHGTAVPGQVVAVHLRVGSARWVVRAVRANAQGRWGTVFSVTRTVRWYVTSRGVRSVSGSTRPL